VSTCFEISLCVSTVLNSIGPPPPRRDGQGRINGCYSLRVVAPAALLLCVQAVCHLSPAGQAPDFASDCISGVAFADDGSQVLANYMGMTPQGLSIT
jgi:hypothetical protein